MQFFPGAGETWEVDKSYAWKGLKGDWEGFGADMKPQASRGVGDAQRGGMQARAGRPGCAYVRADNGPRSKACWDATARPPARRGAS